MNNNENKHKIKPYIYNKINSLSKEYSQRHSKMLVVRADARYPVDYDPIDDNHDIMRSIAKTIQRFKRDGYDPAYAWVREQNRSEHPHYHVLFFLDGKKTQSSKMVFNTFNQFWKSTLKQKMMV